VTTGFTRSPLWNTGKHYAPDQDADDYEGSEQNVRRRAGHLRRTSSPRHPERWSSL